MNSNMFWQILILGMAVVFPTILLHGMYRSIRHRITRGVWPKTEDEYYASERARDWQRILDEANPAVPGTATYEARLEMEMNRITDETCRNIHSY